MDDEMLKNKAQLTRGDTAVLKNLHIRAYAIPWLIFRRLL